MSQGQLGAPRLHPLAPTTGRLPGMCHGDPSMQSCAVTPHSDTASLRGAEGGAEVILWVTAPAQVLSPKARTPCTPGCLWGPFPLQRVCFPQPPPNPNGQ